MQTCSVEITYGLERLCMFVQENNVFDLDWNNGAKYKVFFQAEKEFSAYI